jgi:exodeoxyribonuclease VII small subunit
MSDSRSTAGDSSQSAVSSQLAISSQPAIQAPRVAAADEQPREQTYEQASARVEEIIRRLDSGEASLNQTLELVGEGKTLIELCARELRAVSGALEELRLDELVARLQDGREDGRELAEELDS